MQDRITNFELVKYINKQFSKAAIVFFCTVHAACLCLTAQLTAIDSLLRALKTSQQDSAKIMLNYKLAEQLNQYDRTTADRYLEAGYSMAKASRHIYYIAYFFKIKGGLLFDRGKYNDSGLYFDSAIVSYSELIQAAKQDAKKKEACLFYKTDCLIGKGLIAAKLYNYQQSIQCYLDAITSIENIEGNKKNDYLATLYADIASNYYELEQFEEALKYDKQALPYLNINDNVERYVIGHLFVADDYSGLLQFDSSSLYLEKVRPIVTRLNTPNLEVRFYYILGGIYRKKNDWGNALASFEKANKAAKKMNDNFQVLNSQEGLAACNTQLGNYDKARELALLVLKGSGSLNIPMLQMQALQLLTVIEEKTGKVDNAFQYQKKFILLSDSIKKEKTQKQMHEIEVKYQNEKKEKEILLLQKNNSLQTLSLQKKSAFNYFLTGSVAALLIVGFLGYRNFRHRQLLAKQQDELQEQKIRELEKDKQLVAVDFMLKGQEEERSRIAKDLHDGLGGLLSGVKFSLRNMKDNLISTPENMTVFERSLDMLDSSIRELRRVAHNMMPEMLVKFGLDEAVKEYCNTINTTKLLAVKYQSVGMTERADNSVEIIIYRIIQELLNNTMKHAAATEVFVQLIKEGNRLNVVVEDNGKGFDTCLLENNKGAGLANLRSRVSYLKGQLEIDAKIGKGTLVNIELTL